MKRVKRIASFLLAMVMVLGMGLTALAEQTGKLTINGTTKDKEYDLYQVFELTYTPEVKEGDKVTEAAKYSYKVTENFEDFFNEKCPGQDAVEYVGEFSDNASALSELAKELLAYAIKKNITPTTVTGGEGSSTEVTGLSYGYYLLNPLGGSTPSGDYATMFALNTTNGNNATINVKAVYPTIEKTVADDNEPGKNEVNEIAIGQKMDFHLSTKVPDTTGYKKYCFVIEDTLSTGLTYDSTTGVTVKIGDTTLTKETDYTLTEPSTGSNKIKIVFKDFLNHVKNIAVGTEITVDYKATLNENAVIGTANDNEVKLTYSNDPKVDYKGDEPGPDDPKGETTDKTETYTTSLTLHKVHEVDENGEKKQVPLTGASFKITGTSSKSELKTTVTYTVDADGEYYKKDGEYTTTAPGEDGTGYETKDGNYVRYKKTESSEPVTVYEKADDGEYYKTIDGNFITTAPTDDTLNTYETENGVAVRYKVSVTTIEKEITGGDDKSDFVFSGLGEGIYRISEVVTPEGYNTIEDFPVKITFDSESKTFTATRGYYKIVAGKEQPCFDKDSETDEKVISLTVPTGTTNQFETNVLNKKGVLLPSTGGMGTTIFYVLGGILVLGAGVLLVTRRKMSAEK